ncbi:hypothetical protein NQ034_06260 [Brevibacterium sp. 68QC2CO]|nr:hypothetical protein [Brevibacterium sp. 68QC2CO]
MDSVDITQRADRADSACALRLLADEEPFVFDNAVDCDRRGFAGGDLDLELVEGLDRLRAIQC